MLKTRVYGMYNVYTKTSGKHKATPSGNLVSGHGFPQDRMWVSEFCYYGHYAC